MHSMDDLKIKREYDKIDEFNGDLEFHGNFSRSVAKEYDTEDESERDLGGNGDSNGSLQCKLRSNPFSFESVDDGGSSKLLQ